uniref:Uncharacterized protein n=1 Tax=Cajanus cajan TaxID=3821 RepID=A0A151S1Q8_CAJCA|nr:hypothetical protein KK1_029666 [Cajanus cajan]
MYDTTQNHMCKIRYCSYSTQATQESNFPYLESEVKLNKREEKKRTLNNPQHNFKQINNLIQDLIATNYGDKATPITVSRKLKENGCNIKSSIEGDIGQVNLNDYGSVDPVPSTFQASVHAGPIEHGTPLNPYIIPKPSPPPKF